MVAEDASDFIGLLNGGGGGKKTRPPEEIIKLDDLDSAGEAGPQRQKGQNKPGGRDGGRPEPKKLRHRLGPGKEKFERPGQADVRPKAGGDKKLGKRLKNNARRNRETVFHLIKSELLQAEDTGYIRSGTHERIGRVSQEDILDGATVGIAKKSFSFSLPFGPYACGFTPNGQHLLAGGRKGQIAMLHCDSMKLSAELQVKETVRAVQPLHNQNLFATAQHKYTYIYDSKGVEIHCMKGHKYASFLTFLPYHFLLVSAGDMADLQYRDISTGQLAGKINTRLGPPKSMAHNPLNGVVHLGDSNGCVSLWTPNSRKFAMKIHCHGGHVTGLAMHQNYMVTAGADGLWKIWDMRKQDSVYAFKSYGHSVTDIDVSMTGIVAVAFGSHFESWKGVFREPRPHMPYVKEEYPGKVLSSVRFRPFEDCCAVGHSGGFASIIVPGSGYANFDSFEANPYETKSQRREKEVHSLLEKLQPDTIMLDTHQIGSVDRKVVHEYMEEQKKIKEAEEAEKKKNKKTPKKMRGGNKVGKRLKKKHLQEGKKERGKTKKRVNAAKGAGEEDSGDEGDEDEDEGSGGEEGLPKASVGKVRKVDGAALGRFYGKRRRLT